MISNHLASLWAFFYLCISLTTAAASTPSDDPADWPIDSSIDYRLEASEPFWVVPQKNLPAAANAKTSNNNVAIVFHDGRLFMGWRTAKNHFAGKSTLMHIVSSTDRGHTWTHEQTISIAKDMREPLFLSIKGRLHFYFFEAGTDPVKFEPKHLWRIERLASGEWTEKQRAGADGEVPWEVKVRGGRAYRSSYKGDHYNFFAKAKIATHFKVSDDGVVWEHVNPEKPVIYLGGNSEAGWELDEDGSLWAVTRNEDGDKTGFGSHLASAPAHDLSNWAFPKKERP